ncbi:hypothetical protein GINT2_001264 [Glugoides intestinalis]
MFPYNDFKQILDSTAEMMEKVKTCPKEDKEELKIRIESNMHALRLIASRIDDPEIKRTVLKSIQGLSMDVVLEEKSCSTHRKAKESGQTYTEIIDEDLLKNSLKLKKMAVDFGNCLKEDQNALEKLSGKMQKTQVENGRSLQVLEKSENRVKSSTFIFFAAIIFVIMYFIIRFF